MNFLDFVEYKKGLLAENPEILDLSETRVHEVLKHSQYDFHPDDMPEVSYRCHLAEFWLDIRGWSRDNKPRTLISQGVRHSLEILMRANSQAIWIIPNDVYPVYQKLAEDWTVCNISYCSYPLGYIPEGDILLFCHPTKPRVEPLTLGEKAEIMRWLKRSSRRRIVIDAVYDYFGDLDPFIQQLLETGQAIYLHSLSKSFVAEKIMGICYVPEADVEFYTPIFRALRWEGDKEGFRKAEYLITKRYIPMGFASQILTANMNVVRFLEERARRGRFPKDYLWEDARTTSYLRVIPVNWQKLLEYNVLALPYETFGGQYKDLSVVSSLGWIKNPIRD